MVALWSVELVFGVVVFAVEIVCWLGGVGCPVSENIGKESNGGKIGVCVQIGVLLMTGVLGLES